MESGEPPAGNYPSVPRAQTPADTQGMSGVPGMSGVSSKDHGEKASERDEQIRWLFGERYTPMCRLAALLLDDPSSAEEVVQEAFARVFSSWWRIRKVEAAPAYLRTTVVNLCNTRLRRRRLQFDADRMLAAEIQVKSRISGAGSDYGGNPHTGDHSGADESEEVVAMIQVARAVGALPPRQKSVIVLRYWADLPESEIAAVMHCSAGTVKSQLAKARATLARLLEDNGSSPR